MDVRLTMLIAPLILSALGGTVFLARRNRTPRAAKLVWLLAMSPPLVLLGWAACEVFLAIASNDMRYFGADMAAGIALIVFAVWGGAVSLGYLLGRLSAKRREG
jgi:hypothetical protein